MTAVGIIPARYASRRFPGKPLALIAGVPMIERVWRGASRAKRLQSVHVATDDARIEDCCRSFGAPVHRTAAAHVSGTDRIAEVARDVEADIVVNVQGDEALIEADVIDSLVALLEAHPETPMATAVHPLDPEDRDDPDCVKAFLDPRGRALSFQRSLDRSGSARCPALHPTLHPTPRDDSAVGDVSVAWHHIGLYAYRRDFLFEFQAMPPSVGEQRERLEQLRALEAGVPIQVAVIENWRGISVDRPEDIARVEARLRQDSETAAHDIAAAGSG